MHHELSDGTLIPKSAEPSSSRNGTAPRSEGPDPLEVAKLFKVTSLADVSTTLPGFRWPNLIPEYCPFLLEGAPGMAKTWVALKLASDYTRGRPIGYGNTRVDRPRNVILVGCEDHPSIIRQRFEQCGGDLERFFILEGKIDPQRPDRLLPIDLTMLDEIESAMRVWSPGLVILDPINDLVPAQTDSNRDTSVRAILRPVLELARNVECEIAMIRHWRKGASGDLAEAGIGSQAYAAIARSIMAVARHPDEPEGDRRILAHAKCNYGPRSQSIEFTLEGGRFEWVGLSDVKPNELTGAPRAQGGGEKLDEARDVLTKILDAHGGRVDAKEGKRQLLAAGITEASARRAREDLGVFAHPVHHEKTGRLERWEWRLQ